MRIPSPTVTVFASTSLIVSDWEIYLLKLLEEEYLNLKNEEFCDIIRGVKNGGVCLAWKSIQRKMEKIV